MSEGRRTWIFPDGDLPPPGDPDLPLEGHESLIVVNVGSMDANLTIDIFFPDREPEVGIKATVASRRVRCFRLDKPIGDRQYQIPFGQYALRLHADAPVIAQFGRADVRQPNLSYYTILGYPAD